ncbi:hypothetical protein BO71DRAFT_318084 [Aspergillus ellipticus CBS 707.79]|uniref:Thioesterase domain-containing protein n=1 Tax=Aspergillus ellipticus CBS 707.79 TaxID=1448320 RepID=A0A319DLQ3_9EURO|nr:hypothetical protein BO71DRAFT_318084 [Aspergillus ellipticus CBS 707.79]
MFAFRSRGVLQSRLGSVTLQSSSACRLPIHASRSASTAADEAAPQPSIWPRRKKTIFALFAVVGIALTSSIDDMVAPPLLPGTPEDKARVHGLHALYEIALPIVKKLREDPDYIEADVYGNYSEDEKLQRLSSGPLRGSRGLGLQKIFYNDKEKKAVNVAFLGNGLEGWPTIVHGGVLATVVDEHLARLAIRHFPERTGVTANLELKYRAPVRSNKFYSFHATLDQERSTERKAWVNGEVRDYNGKLCVEATGLFVVPKTYKLQKVGERY